MIDIIFEEHATSVAEREDFAAGWFDAELSDEGEREALELGKRRKGEQFDIIFCSDLQRSYRTAEIAFGNEFIIFQDTRLRECNFGDWNNDERHYIEEAEVNRIDTAYPNGESWQWAVARVVDFLKELEKSNYEKVLIIGHRATKYGIENYINGVPVRQSVLATLKHQPGWEYQLKQKSE